MKLIDPKYGIIIKPNDVGEMVPVIVKAATGEPIPDDEPLMLFRARDHNARAGALMKYREECVADGCNDFHLSGCDNRIHAFSCFRLEHPERMKQPGVTRGL
jgi:hypothetical protein